MQVSWSGLSAFRAVKLSSFDSAQLKVHENVEKRMSIKDKFL
jgi:hypothetical protein